MFFSLGFLWNKKNYTINQIFFTTLYGVILLSLISLSLNFFFALNPIINSITYLSIIIIFFLKFSSQINKKTIYFLVISSLISTFLILYSNMNRPDAGLYHLPYISFLNENKIIFGLSNIHSRFGHVSIVQYLSAINYNIISPIESVIIPLGNIVSIFYIFFFNEILKVFKNKKIEISDVFNLFVIIFISYKINRYSGFGNDALGHLSLFLIISIFLKYNNLIRKFDLILLISVFAFLNKPTMVFIFLFPAIVFVSNYKNLINKIPKTLVSIPSLLLYLWLIKNILISGCFLYPIESTCFSKLSWTDLEKTKIVNVEGEAWNKDWPNKLDKNITFELYNKNFNWFQSWANNHLIKIIKIILPYLLILIFISLIFKKDKKFLLNINYFSCLLISLIGMVIFFLKFPIFRYGYSYLVSFFILGIISFISINKTDKRNLIIFQSIFIICLSILVLKQLTKINNENFPYQAWPKIYDFGNNQFKNTIKKKLGNDFIYYHSNSGDSLCMYSPSPCVTSIVPEKLNVKKLYGYNIIYKNNFN